MIFIVVKFAVRPGRADSWMSVVEGFTAATRAEPGNLFFEWSRSLDEADTFVLTEAFADAAAGSAHVRSDHFAAGVAAMSAEVAEIPKIVNVEVPAAGWARMAEVTPTHAG